MENLMKTHKFLKSEDGNHFYMRREDDWLHVVVHREDGEYVTFTEDVMWTTEYKKGECLINNIYVFNPDRSYVPSTLDEFQDAVRFAVFSLGIYEFTVSLKKITADETFAPNKGASRTESPTSDLIINRNGKNKRKFDFD